MLKSIMDGHGLQALRQLCTTNKKDSEMEIAVWAQGHFQKPLSKNTVSMPVEPSDLM